MGRLRRHSLLESVRDYRDAQYHACGYPRSLLNRPLVGILNASSDMNPAAQYFDKVTNP